MCYSIFRPPSGSFPLNLICVVMLETILIAVLLGAVAASTPDGIAIGAIRWDAWYYNSSTEARPHLDIVGKAVTADMENATWHYRLPFYANISADASINVGLANTTAVAVAQNAYARQTGIDYWAFCAYPPFCKDTNPPDSNCKSIQCCQDNTALAYGLDRYLELDDSQRRGVNFTLLLQAGWFPGKYHGSGESIEQEVARYVSYFQLPYYQTVVDDNVRRPLIYLLNHDEHSLEGLTALRNACKNAGHPAPYVVMMIGSVAAAVPVIESLKADALSSYVLLGDGQSQDYPFANNTAYAQQWYAQAASHNTSLIPTITAGWDNRPRQLYPVPWGGAACKLGPGKCNVVDPTMTELSAAVVAALEFTRQHEQDVTAAKHVIISAWDEFDEGHWICPSLLNGTEKIDAIATAIQSPPPCQRADLI
eukprot:TRINITY_DN9518_c0_g1_i3.p1 TRINITY_DN9518_c0_g1~~TRINITY_DN9518_c0_g1_i3.p1  ORF type:complete len:423 (+),score=53.60 TRINITY_DN9518_c0_g1_i3:818-2086(+)